MKPFLTFLTLSLVILTCEAQTRFQMGGQQVTSSAHRLYVNDQMKTRPSRYTFRTVNEALLFAQANNDKDTLWTDICIEPSVYWIDDPDDPVVRVSDVPRESPFGLKVKVDRLRLIGLSDNPEDVVIACNRGQTQGSDGNFTMLHFTGSDIHAENITFGNYCNVDLVYPRNPRLNRPKRNPAIVQAQLVICRGDRYTIRNCRFISRLNLCPFVGADHVDFDHCYFECTDDALCGTGTYRQCGFTFYGSKPFYATSREGATFIDCDIHSKVRGIQYLTKASSPVTMRDCRWTSDDPDLQLAWTPKPNPKHVCVMTGCTLNGRPYNVPTTPDVPMPLAPVNLPIANQPQIIPGAWTLDAYKPDDISQYNWTVRSDIPVWAFGEGEDGADGCFGLVPMVRGARMMYTGREGEQYQGQRLSLSLDPCKEMDQIRYPHAHWLRSALYPHAQPPQCRRSVARRIPMRTDNSHHRTADLLPLPSRLQTHAHRLGRHIDRPHLQRPVSARRPRPGAAHDALRAHHASQSVRRHPHPAHRLPRRLCHPFQRYPFQLFGIK